MSSPSQTGGRGGTSASGVFFCLFFTELLIGPGHWPRIVTSHNVQIKLALASTGDKKKKSENKCRSGSITSRCVDTYNKPVVGDSASWSIPRKSEFTPSLLFLIAQIKHEHVCYSTLSTLDGGVCIHNQRDFPPTEIQHLGSRFSVHQRTQPSKEASAFPVPKWKGLAVFSLDVTHYIWPTPENFVVIFVHMI